VPTGIKIGVSTIPRPKLSWPRRAWPSVVVNLNSMNLKLAKKAGIILSFMTKSQLMFDDYVVVF
jgi:hypothetical protein